MIEDKVFFGKTKAVGETDYLRSRLNGTGVSVGFG